MSRAERHPALLSDKQGQDRRTDGSAARVWRDRIDHASHLKHEVRE
jgi:hypothetical protein